MLWIWILYQVLHWNLPNEQNSVTLKLQKCSFGTSRFSKIDFTQNLVIGKSWNFHTVYWQHILNVIRKLFQSLDFWPISRPEIFTFDQKVLKISVLFLPSIPKLAKLGNALLTCKVRFVFPVSNLLASSWLLLFCF